jgi:hypothetical protein
MHCLTFQNRFMATKIVLFESREASIAETACQEGRSVAQENLLTVSG